MKESKIVSTFKTATHTSSNNEQEKEYPHYDNIREIIYLIRKLMQAGYLYTKELNKKYNVSAPQLNCLLALYEKGPLSPSQIARFIMVKSSTVTGVIDRLEQKKLVERLRNSPDRRVITVELTEKGKMLARHAPPPIQQTLVDGLKKLSQPQNEQIINDLKLLTGMLDTHNLVINIPNGESHTPI
ncbi:MAG: MarR family transcriptional regulator [Syntrophales bacterium]|nr:MarR family transcriptional regulator [Syntrophales bacterium]